MYAIFEHDCIFVILTPLEAHMHDGRQGYTVSSLRPESRERVSKIMYSLLSPFSQRQKRFPQNGYQSRPPSSRIIKTSARPPASPLTKSSLETSSFIRSKPSLPCLFPCTNHGAAFRRGARRSPIVVIDQPHAHTETSPQPPHLPLLCLCRVSSSSHARN